MVKIGNNFFFFYGKTTTVFAVANVVKTKQEKSDDGFPSWVLDKMIDPLQWRVYGTHKKEKKLEHNFGLASQYTRRKKKKK